MPGHTPYHRAFITTENQLRYWRSLRLRVFPSCWSTHCLTVASEWLRANIPSEFEDSPEIYPRSAMPGNYFIKIYIYDATCESMWREVVVAGQPGKVVIHALFWRHK